MRERERERERKREREYREMFERIKKRHGGRKWANRGAGNP